jgi:hypothetical protein
MALTGVHRGNSRFSCTAPVPEGELLATDADAVADGPAEMGR